MKITQIKPSCNPITVTDGRGGIFTWVPTEPIVEFNLIIFKPGKVRGFHHHPEFIEYILVANGEGVLFSEHPDTHEKETILLSKGVCTRADIGMIHTVHAISELTIIAMLTKKWDDCENPIIQMGEIPR